MLSRKYYKMIAEVIRVNTYKKEDKLLIDFNNFVNDLCEYFKQDNNMFNRDRFEDACE